MRMPVAIMRLTKSGRSQGTTTRSPAFTAVTSDPTSRIPMGSWPITSPTDMNGAMTSMRWRSEPQRPLEVTSIDVGGLLDDGVGDGVPPDVGSAVPGHGAHAVYPSTGPRIGPAQGPSVPQ